MTCNAAPSKLELDLVSSRGCLPKGVAGGSREGDVVPRTSILQEGRCIFYLRSKYRTTLGRSEQIFEGDILEYNLLRWTNLALDINIVDVEPDIVWRRGMICYLDSVVSIFEARCAPKGDIEAIGTGESVAKKRWLIVQYNAVISVIISRSTVGLST